MKTIILRPSLDNQYSDKVKELEKAFKEMVLEDKAVCEDRIVYVFSEKKSLTKSGGNGGAW